jgi:hypothetical protein
VTEAPPHATGDFAALERGYQLPPFALEVNADDVAAYLDATGEQNPLWQTHVPPLAIGAFALGGLMDRFQVPAGLVHTGQEYEFIAPVAIGDPLEVRITVASSSERRGARMVAFAIEVHSADRLVGRGRTTVLLAPEDGSEGAELPA